MNAFFKAVHDLVGFGRWQRHSGGGTAFLVLWTLMVAGMLTGGLLLVSGTTRDVFAALPELERRPIRDAADASLGTGVFQGRLRGPARTSPSGAPSVAWHAWVDRVVRRGKNTSRERLCTISELDGLSLERGSAKTPLLLRPDLFSVTEPGTFAGPQPKDVLLFVDVAKPSLPASLMHRPECKSPDDAPLEYNEISWSDGREIVVSGRRDEEGIGPSGAGADFLAASCGASTSGCTDAEDAKKLVQAHWTGGVTWVTSLVLVMVGVFLAALGGINLRQHRALQKQRRTVARRAA